MKSLVSLTWDSNPHTVKALGLETAMIPLSHGGSCIFAGYIIKLLLMHSPIYFKCSPGETFATAIVLLFRIQHQLTDHGQVEPSPHIQTCSGPLFKWRNVHAITFWPSILLFRDFKYEKSCQSYMGFEPRHYPSTGS